MSRYYEDARQLAFLISKWTQTIAQPRHRFVVCTGGGPGIMEAANRGASEAGGKTIGLNIHLPFEQVPNPYITPELNFEFHYFFMRKLWFAYLAKALVVFPGGFGTFDEMFELLTLAQTQKLAKHIGVVVYGREYWSKIVNFQALVDAGTISAKDLDLIHWADTPEQAYEILRADLEHHHIEHTGADKAPDIAKTRRRVVNDELIASGALKAYARLSYGLKGPPPTFVTRTKSLSIVNLCAHAIGTRGSRPERCGSS